MEVKIMIKYRARCNMDAWTYKGDQFYLKTYIRENEILSMEEINVRIIAIDWEEEENVKNKPSLSNFSVYFREIKTDYKEFLIHILEAVNASVDTDTLFLGDPEWYETKAVELTDKEMKVFKEIMPKWRYR